LVHESQSLVSGVRSGGRRVRDRKKKMPVLFFTDIKEAAGQLEIAANGRVARIRSADLEKFDTKEIRISAGLSPH